MQLARFFITIPNGVLPDMVTIDSLCWGSIDLRNDLLEGVNGGDANSFANQLALRLNTLTTFNNGVLSDLRINNLLVASVLNNVVTVDFYTDAICCGYSVLPTSGGKGDNPFTSSSTDITCPDPNDLPDVNCDDYPDNVHVFRFQFVPQVGFVFGALGTDYRYTVEPSGLINPICNQAISPFQYLVGLSSAGYPNDVTYYNGWAATLNGVWSSNYGGSCVHLGNGIMEIVTDIEIWNSKFPDICVAGLGVQCNFVLADPPISTPSFNVIDISQQCCIPTPPPPWIDPTIEQPPTNDYNTDVEAFCYEFSGFDCCLLGAGGIDTIYISNWAFYKPENPEQVTFGGYGITNDLLGKITSITLLQNTWYELCVNGSLTISQENSGFIHDLECTVPVMTFGNRMMLQQLIWKGLVVIVKDMNARYWFLGEDAPMRPRNIKSTTGGGETLNTFSMEGMQGCLAREIYDTVIPTLNINTFEDCANYVGQPLGTYTLWELRNCLLWDMINNNLV